MNQTDLSQLAEKLGLAIDHLWPHAIRSVMVEGMIAVLISIIAGIAGYFFWRRARITEDEWERAMFYVVAGVSLLIAICLFADGLLHLAEPEGYLVRWILNK